MYNLQNTMLYLKDSIKEAISIALKNKDLPEETIPEFDIEIPAERDHGDLSANVALMSAKKFKMPPRKIAEIILNNLKLDNNLILKSEIAGPGFINFFLNAKFFENTLKEIIKHGKDYGASDFGKGKRIMVEFVSANPTGPMHMGNARLGALGDCLASILDKVGYYVYKEFYVNDAGNQIEKFGLSLDVRYRQICNGKNSVEMPEECYQGQDITDLAQEFFDIHGKKYVDESFDVRKKMLIDFALPKNIERMKKDMEKYKIIYDNWFYESKLHNNNEITKVIKILKKNGYTYTRKGCLWYKSSIFGSGKDDVLIRANGIPTYFAADIAYHYNKFITRKFDTCVDIWGADHHGHVERMKGVMEALGIDRDRLHVILVQLVRLLKNGEIVRMSKRTGKAIQLSDLLDEVGADSARFIFNTHESGSGMDFDLDLAVKQDSQNPVYYVQYAHARICSIFKKLDSNVKDLYSGSKDPDLSCLTQEIEKKLIFYMAMYPQELIKSAKNYDPTKITRYIINLATLFHKFYSSCKIVSEDSKLTVARLYICESVRIILKSILELMKVDAPESMNS
ncbi:MAG: arginine--tRNA ligase [Clostridia bacterium]|nr:arginine--tRNA ligase [Clostridia bacterium]